jgi:hypothetical protein
MNQRSLHLAGVSLTLCLTSCVDLVRTNPLDGDADVTITLTRSRDTLNAYNQTVRFTAQGGAGFENAGIRWTVLEETLTSTSVVEVGTGPTLDRVWTAGAAGVKSGRLTVTAWVGPHSQAGSVEVRQAFGYAAFTPCTRFCYGFVEDGFGGGSVTVYDSLGTAIGNFPAAELAGRVISRNPAIATASATGTPTNPGSGFTFLFAAKAPGSTWLVVPGVKPDSIQVFVDYRPASVQTSCPASISVGSQSQLSAKVLSSSGTELLLPTPLFWSSVGLDGLGQASVSSSGVLTGKQAGKVRVTAAEMLTPGIGKSASCEVTVTP